uniref:Uncharacterized protein n=1 Tax=Globisporangium ultimum (strain ATCC 200006 / CBS 805.95 / DAOM BR144) TaxID=431595 RepID=K3WGJ4_GLOUD
MFNTRLVLLLSDDTTLPPYQAQKELYLARVRCRKAGVLAKCQDDFAAQTLHALGALLQHVEAKGELSGLDVSSGEFHFLDLFRCVVEEDKVLTPLISSGIRQQLTPPDLQNTMVQLWMSLGLMRAASSISQELLVILNDEVHR